MSKAILRKEIEQVMGENILVLFAFALIVSGSYHSSQLFNKYI